MADSIWDTISHWLGLDSGEATMDAATQNTDLINSLSTTGSSIIDEMEGTTDDYLDLSQTGATMYANALGLNGEEGDTAASEAYTTSPGYEWGLSQGEQAIERAASSTGRLQSGNTDLDLLDYATGYAQQDYNNWLDDLSGYNSMYSDAVDDSNAVDSADLSFQTAITDSLASANNQYAAGSESNSGALTDTLTGLISALSGMFGSSGTSTTT